MAQSNTSLTASVFIVRSSDNTLLPILVADAPDGQPRPIPEATALMQSLCARGESLAKMRTVAMALSLFHDYVQILWKGRPTNAEQLPEIVAGFLRARRSGISEPESGLSWSPVKRATLERDRNSLLLFSEFCSERFAHFPLIPMEKGSFAKDGQSFSAVMRRLAARDRMLLGHLDSTRRNAYPTFAAGISERSAPRRSNGKTFLSKALVEDLILGTPSVAQRMAFIQAAFGGQRISEILNMWRSDALPGRYRPVLFPDDEASDIPLLILAHPSQSTYLGETRPGTKDRLQHLHSAYGLRPRNLLESDPMMAGWKGMLYDNESLLISQVFWSDRSWAKIHYALFQELRDKILPLAGESVRNSHPYLIVNDAPGRPEFGQPMKMSNIRKSFSRACSRIGVDAERFRDGIHSLRHGYKASLEALGMSPEEIRKAMHHISVEAQSAYGKSAGALNARLDALLDPNLPSISQADSNE